MKKQYDYDIFVKSVHLQYLSHSIYNIVIRLTCDESEFVVPTSYLNDYRMGKDIV